MNLIEENIILKGLLTNEDYFLKAFPFVIGDLFEERVSKKIFDCIKKYNDIYNRQPSLSVIKLYAEKVTGITDDEHTKMLNTIQFFETPERIDVAWLLDATVEWIKTRNYYDSIVNAAEEYQKGNLDAKLPDKISQALSITFDTNNGMELSDIERRWDMYTNEEARLPFVHETLNQITKGGVTRKTLNLFQSAKTGGCKSLCMCDLASGYKKLGYNVLYVTLEMSEDKVLERIDANLLDVEVDNIRSLGKEKYMARMSAILQQKTEGRIIVKEYPTSIAHVGHIRYLLRELKLKNQFVPDVLFVDYLGIMAAMTAAKGDAEHMMLKKVSEELRGLAVQENLVVWTAQQSNRDGAQAVEGMSISDISGSYAISFVCDMMLGLVTTPELDEQNKIMMIQVKNRYGDANHNNKFFMGLCKPKMRIYDLSNGVDFSAQSIENEQRELEKARTLIASRQTKNFTNFSFS